MPNVKAPAQAHISVTPEQKVNMPSSHGDSASSDHESESEISFHLSRQQATIPVRQQMLMPYIEGPKMDWTVNDRLYHCFLKWKLNCENKLECELAALPEPQQCKKINSLEWGFWNGPVCVMGLDKR